MIYNSYVRCGSWMHILLENPHPDSLAHRRARWLAMFELKHIGANELAVLATICGLVLADNQTPEEQNVLGNFIVGIGCTILVIASQAEYISQLQEQQKTNEDNLEIRRQILEMQRQIKDIIGKLP